MMSFTRNSLFHPLWHNLGSRPNLIQVIIGPRQIGKTTLALQLFKRWSGPKIYQAADSPDVPSLKWLADHWQRARDLSHSGREVLLVLDEIQKIPRWSGKVKNLFDEDRRFGNRVRVVLLGSSALLMQRGLTESLAGRFEIHHHWHWSFSECQRQFSLTLPQYLIFGGFPGAVPLRGDWERWSRYIRDSLIETVLSKDILLMTPVAKPALLRQVFGLATAHPAQIISFQKMLGQLQDAGNTTTIASYLRLLAKAFLVTGLSRWSGSKIKQRGSIPKLIALDNALVSAMSGRSKQEIVADRSFWGRLVENAVGAKLYALLEERGGELLYWRERQQEVDFVFMNAGRLIAVEVKSSEKKPCQESLKVFFRRYQGSELIIISPKKIKNLDKGIKSISLDRFFSKPEIVLQKG